MLSFDPVCMGQLDVPAQPGEPCEILILEKYKLISPQRKVEADKMRPVTTCSQRSPCVLSAKEFCHCHRFWQNQLVAPGPDLSAKHEAGG